ncbi:unnamed protein product [Adineta steineri]|uniref:Uncharacterized protein n=1 Tax=Adineta steineri TaxID=433720 RepID=A0A820AYN2_9BILA|nr:unnamed protein product [Adineta steineri]CAF4200055.1 unnamed protein product [Adineta steineri]
MYFTIPEKIDRITLVAINANSAYVRSHCSIADGWSVISKLYVPWITKDSFCNGRPPPELLSVSPYNIFLTEYVEAYKCMKMHHIQKCVIVIFMNNEKCIRIERVSNRHIKDVAVRGICGWCIGISKNVLVPTIVEQHKQENDPHYCAIAISA